MPVGFELDSRPLFRAGFVHDINSEQVLGKSRGPALPIAHSDEPHGQPAGTSLTPRPPNLGETPMKKLLIAVALVVSFAAPAMADNFPNVYATHLGR